MTTPYYLGIFENEQDVLSATRKSREAGYTIHDVFTPYAVHGLDEAMGLKRNLLTWVCLGFALAGLLFAVWFQFWIGSINWPLNVGGRPFNSLPAYLPVMFELTVLVGGVGVVVVMLARNRLYPGKQEQLVDRAVTNDRFVIVLREEDASFDPKDVEQLWAQDGVVETREVKEATL